MTLSNKIVDIKNQLADGRCNIEGAIVALIEAARVVKEKAKSAQRGSPFSSDIEAQLNSFLKEYDGIRLDKTPILPKLKY